MGGRTQPEGRVFTGPMTGVHFGRGDVNVWPAAQGQSGRRGAQADDSPTAGIVTALPEEYAAVRALLDSPAPLAALGDRASYVSGTVPSTDRDLPHRVVVTLLSEAGNDAAATACTNLIRSYPSVKFVIMAGIAAGVPSPEAPTRHVRLGDIVVASWGVVDYDHVDVRPDGVALRGGFPQPSPVLRGADRYLEAEEMIGNRPWERWLSTAARPDLRQFTRPHHRTDVLHSADETGTVVPHPRDRDSERRPGVPKVHRGFIGSADRSLRDARVRDALAAAHGLRALEMEGRGIGKSSFLNGFEWFVVRGISDYGDSRTTPLWRKYASLAAAAYVRELLAKC